MADVFVGPRRCAHSDIMFPFLDHLLGTYKQRPLTEQEEEKWWEEKVKVGGCIVQSSEPPIVQGPTEVKVGPILAGIPAHLLPPFSAPVLDLYSIRQFSVFNFIYP